ncbi:unnamed protein product [Peronospora belbahrii]|uniref:Uncharacterized protein n=1 Tax=Peronospora belbahrii TaxID=622444 RepID=A0ABN8CMX3_9STRA|nr:unnamed protein product [Peronospora belbahrii]
MKDEEWSRELVRSLVESARNAWHIRYLCACSGEALGYEATLTTRVSMSELGNAAVLIGGMTSNSCAISVENALENTENVMLVIGSFGTEKARICFNKDFVGI